MGYSRVSGSDRCFRCGAVFADGGLRYRVDIRVAADIVGELRVEDPEAEIKRLLDAIKGRDEDELEREVHTDYAFYLCGPCKDEYLRGPDVPLGRFFFGK